jgi:hypothetical protein
VLDVSPASELLVYYVDDVKSTSMVVCFTSRVRPCLSTQPDVLADSGCKQNDGVVTSMMVIMREHREQCREASFDVVCEGGFSRDGCHTTTVGS